MTQTNPLSSRTLPREPRKVAIALSAAFRRGLGQRRQHDASRNAAQQSP